MPANRVQWCAIVLLIVATSFQMPAHAQPSTHPASAPATTQSSMVIPPGPWQREHLRLPDMPLHDPWILALAPTKTYYLYTSNLSRMTGVRRGGTMVYKSKDLSDWSGPSVVFTSPDEMWADPKIPAWAPEVHEYRGRFYLFTTLHNPSKVIAEPPAVWRNEIMRGTTISVSDSPDGPFTLLDRDAPIAPADFMTLDGTFYLDESGNPWMVYAHEWVQKIDGTMEAIPLKPDLSAADGKPMHLFKASDAPWLDEQMTPSKREQNYVTDGPELFRTRDGHLLMLWSSYDNTGYVQTIARSKSGRLKGPWEQLPPLLRNDSGHGMLFRTFDGQLMLILHRPFRKARGKLYEIEDAGDHLRVIRERTDLDSEP